MQVIAREDNFKEPLSTLHAEEFSDENSSSRPLMGVNVQARAPFVEMRLMLEFAAMASTSCVCDIGRHKKAILRHDTDLLRQCGYVDLMDTGREGGRWNGSIDND